IVSVLPSPAAAEPGVPYCAGSASPVPNTVPTVLMPEVCETSTGRVFPAATPNSIAGSPNALPGASTAPVSDYVSYQEFQAGLDYLANSEMGKQYLTVYEVAQSVGLCPQPAPSVPLVGSGGDCPTARDRFP